MNFKRTNMKKNRQVDIFLLYIVYYKWITLTDVMKFGFNFQRYIIYMVCKNDFEQIVCQT